MDRDQAFLFNPSMARVPLAFVVLFALVHGARAADPFHGGARLRSDHADDDPGWRGEDLQVGGFFSVLAPNPPPCAEHCTAGDDEGGYDGIWGGGASVRWHPRGPFTGALTLFTGRSFGGAEGLARFDLFELRLDLRVDIGRRKHTIGVGFRVSPTLSLYFLDSGPTRIQAQMRDLIFLPPIALTIGTSQRWVEVGASSSCFGLDPRIFYVVWGERGERWGLELGAAIIGAATVVSGTVERDDDIEGTVGTGGGTARAWLEIADDFALELHADVGFTLEWLVRTSLGVRVNL